MRAISLKTNHLTAPVGIDAGPLFLSWQCADGVCQTAYEIELTANGETVWHSGKVQSTAMHADAPAVGGSRVRGCWRVRLWDENGAPGAWSAAHFETGLAQSDWQGKWVDPETEEIDIPGDDAINAFARPNWESKQAEKEAAGKGAAEPYKPHRPASYLRKVFTAPKSDARLYITAKGLYVAWLNGKRIGDMQAMMNPRKSVGTAYLAYSGRLLAEVADALGKADEAANYRDTAANAVKAYRAAFTENGVIKSDRQCEYVRAIAFALLGENESKAAAATLNQMVIENGCHLNTGFLSTPFLCDVLAKNGYTDTAYKLLLQPDAPGWLYEVGKGATTVWETWTGIDENGRPHESLNHYSYGAICGWLFGGVCGILYADGVLTIAPTPDKSLGWAKSAYDSPAGRIVSGWRYDGDAVTYEFEIPANLTADVTLPDGRKFTLGPGKHTV